VNLRNFVEWQSALSIASRVSALALICSSLTIAARQIFAPEWSATPARRDRALEILRGLNEVHHTLSNHLVAYATDEHRAYAIQGFGEMLSEIENKYHLEQFLTPAIEFAQTRKGGETLHTESSKNE